MTTPLDVAREADRMGQLHGRKDFQQLAFWCMAIMALTSVLQAGTHVMRELNRREATQSRGR